MKFTDLNLSEDIQSAVVAAGFEQPSPIQELTIPLALEGKDVIGQAQTGTGKTAAFGLPTLDKIRTEENTIQAWLLPQHVSWQCNLKKSFSVLAVIRALRFAQYTVVLASRNKSRPSVQVPTL